MSDDGNSDHTLCLYQDQRKKDHVILIIEKNIFFYHHKVFIFVSDYKNCQFEVCMHFSQPICRLKKFVSQHSKNRCFSNARISAPKYFSNIKDTFICCSTLHLIISQSNCTFINYKYIFKSFCIHQYKIVNAVIRICVIRHFKNEKKPVKKASSIKPLLWQLLDPYTNIIKKKKT